jgi:hypothetical protein
MSFVTKVEKPIEDPRRKSNIRIRKDVDFDKLAPECRKCLRLKYNKGECGGREGQNICLAFVESPTAKVREKMLQRH